MLQQTQVATVIPYFTRWMARFPTIESLAGADEQEALALWQGLGYYRRCRNLLAGAKRIVSAGIPTNAQEWRSIPGVGKYTAGAIASIAHGERTPVVDGNVLRVYARLFALPIAGATLEGQAWKWAENAVDPDRPGDFNQALMELGATLCRPTAPACGTCPVQHFCLGNQLNTPTAFPPATPKSEVRNLEYFVRVPYLSGAIGFERIPDGEWWQGLWRLPNIPRESAREPNYLDSVKATVTHHRLTFRAYWDFDSAGQDLRWVPLEEITGLALPAPYRKILELALKRLAESGLFDLEGSEPLLRGVHVGG